jgi:hypothetical protein
MGPVCTEQSVLDRAFAFDSGSGFDGLVVANNGNGTLALFEGGEEGLSLMSTASDPELPSPTALVYAGIDGSQVQFYAAPVPLEPVESPQPVLAQLVPLQESSLALVGTLLILTIESPTDEADLAPAERGDSISRALLRHGRPGGPESAHPGPGRQ